jgi:hypothetical protein
MLEPYTVPRLKDPVDDLWLALVQALNADQPDAAQRIVANVDRDTLETLLLEYATESVARMRVSAGLLGWDDPKAAIAEVLPEVADIRRIAKEMP